MANAVVDTTATTMTVPAAATTTFYREGGTTGSPKISISGNRLIIRHP